MGIAVIRRAKLCDMRQDGDITAAQRNNAADRNAEGDGDSLP